MNTENTPPNSGSQTYPESVPEEGDVVGKIPEIKSPLVKPSSIFSNTVPSWIAISIVAVMAIFVGFYIAKTAEVISFRFPWESNETVLPLVGNDRDEHGCIPSAGYSWCEAKQKCLRVWEEKCQDVLEENSQSTTTKLLPEKIVYTTNMGADKNTFEADCSSKGGKFNECGSPCPSSAEGCIAVCAYTCEFDF